MANLIDRDELLEELNLASDCSVCPRAEEISGTYFCRGHLKWLCGKIMRMPTVQEEGEWKCG